MIVQKKNGKPDLDQLTSDQRDNIKHKKYRSDTDDYEIEFWEGFEIQMIRDEVRQDIADLIENAGDLSNPAERKKLADELRKKPE